MRVEWLLSATAVVVSAAAAAAYPPLGGRGVDSSSSSSGSSGGGRLPLATRTEENQLPAEVDQMLEEWSGIAPADSAARMRECLAEAHKIDPNYSSAAGGYRAFLPGLQSFPHADELVLKPLLRDSSETFLELGAYLAPDLRWLAWKGAPARQLKAANLVDTFSLAWGFYGDIDRTQGADFLAPGDVTALGERGWSMLGAARGRATRVYFRSLFGALRTGEDKRKAARGCLELLRRGRESYVLAEEEMYAAESELPGGGMLKQSDRGWRAMWADAAKAAGARVEFDDRTTSSDPEAGTAWFKYVMRVTFD